MQPIVHGLERQYGARVDFLYLDVQDQRTNEAKTRLGYQATPHFFLLTADGKVVQEWQGVHSREVLETGLRSVIGGRFPPGVSAQPGVYGGEDQQSQ